MSVVSRGGVSLTPRVRGSGFVSAGAFVLLTAICVAGAILGTALRKEWAEILLFFAGAVAVPTLFLLMTATYLRRVRAKAGTGDVILFTSAVFQPGRPDRPASTLRHGWLRLEEETLEVWESRRTRCRGRSSVSEIVTAERAEYAAGLSQPLLRIRFRDGSIFEGIMAHSGMRGFFGLDESRIEAWRQALLSRLAGPPMPTG